MSDATTLEELRATLETEPEDVTLRRVCADALEEAGQEFEARRQRAIANGYERMDGGWEDANLERLATGEYERILNMNQEMFGVCCRDGATGLWLVVNAETETITAHEALALVDADADPARGLEAATLIQDSDSENRIVDGASLEGLRREFGAELIERWESPRP